MSEVEKDPVNKANTAQQDNEVSEKPFKVFAEKFKEWVGNSMPLTLAISLAAFFYIFLVHKHVKQLRELELLKVENQELRSELIAIQTDLMTSSKQSELSVRLSSTGLKEMRQPPRQLKKKSK